MNFVESRREFMATGARVGAAGVAIAATRGAIGAIGAIGASGALASTLAPASVTQCSPELLQALGARIGLEVATKLGAVGSPLALAYLDAAGPSVDALRDGIEQGVAWHAGAKPSSLETQVTASAVLGVALLSNPDTGRSARVEIDATALSMIAMIESGCTPPSAQKNAVLTANASSLYRVSYFS